MIWRGFTTPIFGLTPHMEKIDANLPGFLVTNMSIYSKNPKLNPGMGYTLEDLRAKNHPPSKPIGFPY